MKFILKVLGAVVLTAMGSVATTAQEAKDESAPETEVRLGSRIPVPVEPTPVEDKNAVDASRTFMKWGRCVVKKDSDLIAARFAAPFTEDAMWVGSKRAMSQCLGGLSGARMSGSSKLFFGVFAQELYLKTFATRPALSNGALRSIATDAVEPKANPMLMFADCIARNAPEASDYIVRSEYGSEAETEGFKSASQVFKGCLDENNTVKTNKFTLRLRLQRHFTGAQWVWSRHRPLNRRRSLLLAPTD